MKTYIDTMDAMNKSIILKYMNDKNYNRINKLLSRHRPRGKTYKRITQQYINKIINDMRKNTN